jgi:hypothetical protein
VANGPLVTIRCVRCGRLLVAPVPPSAEPVWFACPHCAQPVPVVAPRDPPPLFSWEVYPHLYPPARPPKVPGPAVGRLLVALLLTGVVVLVGLAGALSWAGVSSLQPGAFTVEGVVTLSESNGATVPSVGSLVNLTSETGEVRTVATGSDGSFAFSDVPPGGIVLNVSAAGYGPVLVELFASSVYSTVGVGRAVDVSLAPGTVNNVTYLSYTPFGDLDGFLTSLGSSAVLLGLCAVAAAVGTVAAYRGRRLPYAVAGAGAAIAGSLAPGLLGVETAFPVVTWFAGLAISTGAVALGLATVRLASLGTPPDDGPVP